MKNINTPYSTPNLVIAGWSLIEMELIRNLLDKIESNEIVLPEFQREFVWKKSQAKELMKSLYEGYPIGSLLIWVTRDPPEIKNDAVDREQYGLFKVLLDGQQRLTVLYLLVNDKIPPYYKDEDIRRDPRSLYFNLTTGEFRFENKTIRESLEWVKVNDIFNDEVKVFELAREKADDGEDIAEIAENYNTQKKRLEDILSSSVPVQELPKSADVHQAIELFDKVNSQGTDLGDAELALAHMSAQWPYIRRHMKKTQSKLKEKGYDFNLEFYVKSLIAVVTGGMTYEKVYDTPKDVLKSKWSRIEKTMNFLTNILKNEYHMPDSTYFSTSSALIPLITYVEKKNMKLNRNEKNDFQRWLYAALMWSRYGGSTDTKLEKDLSLLEVSDRPTKGLVEEIEDQRGRIELEQSDLEGRGKRSKRFYNMLRVITRTNNPVDWKTGEPLKGSYELHSHHIFPKSKLYHEIYDPKNHIGKKRVNEIANRVFMTARGNREIFDDLPENYLPEVRKEHPEALKSQLIPDNPELWKIENYEDFLKKRRKMIAEKINDFMDSLEEEIEGEDEKGVENIKNMIKKGESDRVEFKETILYDVYQNQANKELKYEAVKEICAFTNSNGGTLIIGVEDENKEIKGIERDLKLMRKGKDSFELQLNQAISDKISESFASMYTQVQFEEINGKEVCVVSVEESPDPVYYGDEKAFYVRIGSSSRPLNPEEMMEYIEEEFK